MLYTNAADIDFSNYQRLFVIGCSFSNWLWPTWADIIVKEHSHLEYINVGFPGAGNDYIQCMLSQISRKYKLGSNDIVMIMWSSFHRDTMYTMYNNESGELADAIINQTPKTELTKHCFNWNSGYDLIAQKLEKDTTANISDGRGYLIKNLATIDAVTSIAKNADYSVAQMLSVGIHNQCKFDDTCLDYPKSDVLELYKDIPQCMLGDAYYEMSGYTLDQIIWDDGDTDYHPKSIEYYNYLGYLGFEFSENTKYWCTESDNRVKQAKYSDELEEDDTWPYTKYPMNIEYPL